MAGIVAEVVLIRDHSASDHALESELLLLGIPFVLRERHKSPVAGVGLCLVLSSAYFVVDFLLRDLGNRGSLPPVAAAWLPPLVFGSLGLATYDSMRT